ncbi:GNAT family N-acetyltransferase [Mesorhizobium sp. 1B3]|uniref:GNAT family N-acetyltransferase n=1 Tax=Mesorhizobium sp. 1B3 TaxID=3243599 RepID=UPI003D9969AC
MKVDIRPASESDADALVAIENESFKTDRISRRSFQRLLGRGSCALLVARSEIGLLGYCLVLFREGASAARLYSIAVNGAGGAGLGRALLQAAEQAALLRGKKRLRLEVREDNNRARHLYERNGYRYIGTKQDYYADGMPALRYEKQLDATAGGTSP